MVIPVSNPPGLLWNVPFENDASYLKFLLLTSPTPTRVQPLDGEDLLEEGMATHSSIPAANFTSL